MVMIGISKLPDDLNPEPWELVFYISSLAVPYNLTDQLPTCFVLLTKATGSLGALHVSGPSLSGIPQ